MADIKPLEQELAEAIDATPPTYKLIGYVGRLANSAGLGTSIYQDPERCASRFTSGEAVPVYVKVED